MKMPVTLMILLLSGGLTMTLSGAQDDDRTKALMAPFERMEKAIRSKDEAGFKGAWHAEGYAKNLTGGSGLSGEEVYAQGARKGWHPKPDVSRIQLLAEGAVAIVPCAVWSWEQGKALDKVAMAVVTIDGQVLVLGGGEKVEEVRALADRWIGKRPLAPEGK